MTNTGLQEGTLPGGWHWTPLSDIALINPPRRSNLPYRPDTPVTFVPMQAVNDVTGTIHWPETKPFSQVSKGYTYFEEGDVLFAKITPCMQNGKHAIACGLANGFGFGTTEFHVIRPGGTVMPEWLHRFLRQPWLLAEATRHFRGAVGQQRLPKEFLQNLAIPLPPLAEQKRIVRILNGQLATIERAKEAAEERLEAARALREAFVLRAFRTSSTCPWPKRTLLELCEGKGQYGTSKKSNFNGVGVPVLGMGNIREGRVAWDDIKHTELSASELVKFRLKRGDLLFNRTNSAELVGKSAVYNDHADAGFASYLIRFKIHPERADSRFVCTYINSPQGRSFIRDNLAQAVGQANISASTMHGMLVPTPPLQQQIELSDLLEVVDSETFRLRSAMQSDIWDLDSTTAALLRRAFSGAIE